MKKLLFMALLPLLFVACDPKKPSDNNAEPATADTDTLLCDDGVIEDLVYSDGLRPLFVIRYNEHQFIHPFSFEELYADNEYGSVPEEGYSCEEMIANADKYTWLEEGPKVYPVSFNRVQKGSWDHGFINWGQEYPEMNGIIYDLDRPLDNDNAYNMLLVDEDFSCSHTAQYVTNSEWYDVSDDIAMPKELQVRLEEELQFPIKRSHLCATISDPGLLRDDAHFYIIQTEAKGETMLGAMVLEWENQIAYSVDTAYYDTYETPTVFTWHVDDDGVYFPRNIMAAYYTMDGDLQLYYIDQSPESTSLCRMQPVGKELKNETLNSYYNYY